jgi:hypothetical protein
MLRNISSIDSRVYIYDREQLAAFEEEADKTATGDPTSIFYEPKRTRGTLTLEMAASDVTKVLRMMVLSPADDLDASTNDLAFPQEWFAALEWELAKRLSTPFTYHWTQVDESNWNQATMIARKTNPRGFIGGFMSQDSSESDPSL